MNDYLLSLLLGVVEGVTEFLPVSSTAHLRIAEALLHIDLADGFWKMYSVVIQLGAILALPILFRARIAALLASFPRGERGDKTPFSHPLSLVAAAFVCTAAPAFLLTKVIGKHLESLVVMGVALVVGGVVMWAVDAARARAEAAGPGSREGIGTWRMDDMSLGQAIWIGCCQVLSAVFPGTSRSMATIAAGQVAGMSRAAALEFSFFVSIPTMAAATLYDLWKTLRGTANPLGAAGLDVHGWVVLTIGFAVAFVVAYASVAWFLAFVRRHGFAGFAVYRVLAGIAVLLFLARG